MKEQLTVKKLLTKNQCFRLALVQSWLIDDRKRMENAEGQCLWWSKNFFQVTALEKIQKCVANFNRFCKGKIMKMYEHQSMARINFTLFFNTHLCFFESVTESVLKILILIIINKTLNTLNKYFFIAVYEPIKPLFPPKISIS